MNHNTVTLRAMEPEDLDLLYKIENDRSLWGVGTTNVPYSRYALHDYIANASGNIYADGQVRLMIDNEEGQAVGVVDIVNFDPKNLRGEIGLVVECSQRRKGYATAAIRALTDYARRVLHLHQLYAIVDAGNAPTVQLFATLGYRPGARLADWLFDGTSYHDAVVLQLML